MNSPKSSLIEALTTYDVNEDNGVVQLNVADALFAIATAINRLAAVQERAQSNAAQSMARVEAMMFGRGGARQ